MKKLHQQSESNTKPSCIMGHSCQAVCVLASGLRSIVVMRNTLPDFLADDACAPCLTKSIRDRLDLKRAEGTRLVA